jgi:hypothetical protein
MKNKPKNKIQEHAEQNSFRLDEIGKNENMRDKSRSTSEEENLNALGSSKNERTPRGSRKENQQSNKSIAIIKE